MNAALIYLLRAVEHARHACERTRRMVVVAIAKLQAVLAIAKAAAT